VSAISSAGVARFRSVRGAWRGEAGNSGRCLGIASLWWQGLGWADGSSVTRFNKGMRNWVWVAMLGVLLGTGVGNGSVENLHPVPDGLADLG
jgi:hypothetical protein